MESYNLVIEKPKEITFFEGYGYTYVLNNPLKYTDPSGYKFAELPAQMVYYNIGWLKHAGYGWSDEYGGHATVRRSGGGYGYNVKYNLGPSNPYEWQYDGTGDYVNRRTGEHIDAGYGADAIRAMGWIMEEVGVEEFLELAPIVEQLGKEAIFQDEMKLATARNIGYGKSYDGDPEKEKMSAAISFALVASAADGPLPFGEAIGIAVIGATAINTFLKPQIKDNYYDGPFYTDRPNNYIPPPVPAGNNMNYFPNGNGNNFAKWFIRVGGTAVLGKKLYEGFSIDSTSLFHSQDNTYVAPFYTPIPDPNKGY